MESTELAVKFHAATISQRYVDYRGQEYLEAVAEIIALAPLISRDYEIARKALEKICFDSDYCYVCDCHPSHGHAKDCILR